MIRGPIDGKYVELWGIPAWRRKLGIGDESLTLTQRIESIIAGTANGGPDIGPGSVENANARLAAFATLEEAGYIVQTSTFPPAFAGRQIVGVPNRINVTHGTGINGNTILQTPQDIDEGATPSFQTIKPLLLNPDFVTYVDAAGELASTSVTATALEAAVGSIVAMDILTTRGDLLSHDGTTYIRVGIGAANTVARTDGLDVLWGKVDLTTDVTGVLPVANGGTNKASWTAGSVIFAGVGGTSLTEDNTGIFYDDVQNFLGLGVAVPLTKVHLFQAGANDVSLLFQNANGFAALEYDGPTGDFRLNAISGPLELFAGNQIHIEMNGSGATYVVSGLGTVNAHFGAAGGVGIGTGTFAPGALLDLGRAGTTLGVMRMAGSTSGNVTIQPQAIAGTWTLQLPIDDGAVGSIFTSNGSGVTAWTTVLPIANGGTNSSGGGAYSIGYIDATATQLVISDGALTYDAAANTLTLLESGSVWNAISLSHGGQVAGDVIKIQLWLQGTDAFNTVSNLIVGKEQNWTGVAATRDSYISIETVLDNVTGQAIGLRSSGSVILGKDSTGTTRTDDFTYICQTNGVPTGVPTTFGNRVPITFDPNTDTLYVYRGGWKGVVLL